MLKTHSLNVKSKLLIIKLIKFFGLYKLAKFELVRKKWGNSLIFKRRIIYINPKRINFFLQSYGKGKMSSLSSYIRDGDWDLHKVILNNPDDPNQIGYRSMIQIFHEKKSITESEQFLSMVEKIELNGYVVRDGKNLVSISDVLSYFENLREIFTKMSKQGYKNQLELGDFGSEIGVVIDRNGNFLKVGGGRHRFAMALLLKLNSVPVEIRFVHHKWALECQKKYKKSLDKSVYLELKALSEDYS